MELAQLPAILRVLLGTDGTVTRSLQAYFAEPIEVEVLQQAEISLSNEDPLVGADAGQTVIKRRVKLLGARSARLYACAETLINPDHLPGQLAMDITQGRIGVGEIVQQRNLETRREIVDISLHLMPLSLFDDSVVVAQCAYRHYLIVHAGKVLMHIKEYFPLSSYSEGPTAVGNGDADNTHDGVVRDTAMEHNNLRKMP